ncbi:MAG: hypothetical protein ACT4O1_16670 [Gemmatimonadota bacterium]
MIANKIAAYLIVLSACGGVASDRSGEPSTDSVAAAQPPAATVPIGAKACDLLTLENLVSATKHEFKAGVVTNDYMGVSQCRWDRSDKGQDGVMVTLHDHGEISNYRDVPGSVAVIELGAAAVWNAQTSQLAVEVDSAVFSISFLFSPVTRQWAEQLARAALARLEAHE